MNTKVSIVTGLPGSGKTTLAKEMYEKITKKGYGKACILIPLDDYQENTFQEIMDKNISRRDDSCFHFIIEGLLLENNSIIDCLNAFKNNRNGDIDVTIHYFNEDRETCLHNDIGRREKSSRITIENAKYEIPNASYIAKETGLPCKLQKHMVIRKTDYDMFRDLYKLGSKNDRYDALYSASWSLGGTYGNCWDSKLRPISPEPPRDFHEFDKLLEQICPNITFMQYKKIERECTKVVEWEDSDYYGGIEYRANHKCDLRKLYDVLNEMGYINLQEQMEEDLDKER